MIRITFFLLLTLLPFNAFSAETILNCSGLIFKRDKSFFGGDVKYLERIDGEWISYCSKNDLELTVTKDSAKCRGFLIRPTPKELSERKDIFKVLDYENYEVIDFYTKKYIIKKKYSSELYVNKKINCNKM